METSQAILALIGGIHIVIYCLIGVCHVVEKLTKEETENK